MTTEKTPSSTSVDSIVHTPGPWEQYDDWYVRASGGKGALTTVCKPLSPQVSDNQCRANARLIAAAPDLLEALQLLWTEVSESGNATANDFGWRKAREATLAALRKVV